MPGERSWWLALRLLIALVPTLWLAAAASAHLARVLPVAADVRFCVAYYLPLPLWVVLACGVMWIRLPKEMS